MELLGWLCFADRPAQSLLSIRVLRYVIRLLVLKHWIIHLVLHQIIFAIMVLIRPCLLPGSVLPICSVTPYVHLLPCSLLGAWTENLSFCISTYPKESCKNFQPNLSPPVLLLSFPGGKWLTCSPPAFPLSTSISSSVTDSTLQIVYPSGVPVEENKQVSHWKFISNCSTHLGSC